MSDLGQLGLNAYESGVYLALLARGGQTSTEVAARAKVPRQRIYDVLRSLAVKGLCSEQDTSPRTFFPIDPAVALPVLSAQRAAELDRERARTEALAQDLAAELGPIFQAGQSENDPLKYVEMLSSPDRIAAKAVELATAARSQVNSLVARPMILSAEQNREFLHVPLERGVRYRALYEESALADSELRGLIEELGPKGQEIRIVPSLPVKMQAFDDEVAILSMKDPVGGPPTFTALVLRHRGAVALLNLAFERLWERANPIGGVSVDYVSGYVPGAIGRIAEMHGVYYAEVWGSGAEFEGMMAEEMREFVSKYDDARDLMLTAWVEGRLVGSIVVQGTDADCPGARLRWVIVEPAFHGRGIGKEMLRRALSFCRSAGFSTVYLWTVEGLPQSMGLYSSFGFEVVERIPDARYSVPRVNLRLELTLT